MFWNPPRVLNIKEIPGCQRSGEVLEVTSNTPYFNYIHNLKYVIKFLKGPTGPPMIQYFSAAQVNLNYCNHAVSSYPQWPTMLFGWGNVWKQKCKIQTFSKSFVFWPYHQKRVFWKQKHARMFKCWFFSFLKKRMHFWKFRLSRNLVRNLPGLRSLILCFASQGCAGLRNLFVLCNSVLPWSA